MLDGRVRDSHGLGRRRATEPGRLAFRPASQRGQQQRQQQRRRAAQLRPVAAPDYLPFWPELAAKNSYTTDPDNVDPILADLWEIYGDFATEDVDEDEEDEEAVEYDDDSDQFLDDLDGGDGDSQALLDELLGRLQSELDAEVDFVDPEEDVADALLEELFEAGEEDEDPEADGGIFYGGYYDDDDLDAIWDPQEDRVDRELAERFAEFEDDEDDEGPYAYELAGWHEGATALRELVGEAAARA